MYKKTIFIFLLFFLFPLTGVFASDSPAVPSQCDGGLNNFGNCTSSFVSDNVYASKTLTGSDRLVVSGFNFNIPLDATINKFAVWIEGYRSGGSGTQEFLTLLTKNSVLNYFGTYSGGCYSSMNIDINTSEQDNSTEFLKTCYSTNITPQDVNDSTFALRLDASNSNASTYYVDRVILNINYTPNYSRLNIDSATASPSGQFVSMNLSGTTSTVSATMQCSIRMLERCTKSGYASKISSSSVATIFLDALYTEQKTVDIGGGFYKGYNWGGTDPTWIADNIHVPYNAGWSCDYPYSSVCTDNGETFLDDFTSNPLMIATPSAGLTNTEITEPEPTNPLAWVVWKIRQTAIELFIPHDEVLRQYNQYMTGLVQTKAPLAYGNAVLALNWSSGSISSSAPTLHIPLTANAGGIIPDINWIAPAFFTTAMGYFRGALNIVLWLSFILYIIVRVRGVFV